MDCSKIDAEGFERYLFEDFHVKRPEQPAANEEEAVDVVDFGTGEEHEPELELMEVDRLHRIRKLEGGFVQERKRDPFTLLFRGSHESVLADGMHSLIHEKLGVIEVYLHAVNVDPVHETQLHPQGRFYEVHYN